MTRHRLAENRPFCFVLLVAAVVAVPWFVQPVDEGAALVTGFLYAEILLPIWAFLSTLI